MPDPAPPRILLVSTGSIGRGVPEPAAQGFARIESMLRSSGYSPEIRPWGLEGERRLCLQLSGQEDEALIDEIHQLAKGTELLSVETSADANEHCDPGPQTDDRDDH